MITSYNHISKEVGYEGRMHFPTMDEMETLLDRLSWNPSISDFKKALSLYRFLPETKTQEQHKIVYMLQLGLSSARKALFIPEVRQPYTTVAVNYIKNFIPSLTLFYMVRYTVVNQDLLFQF